MTKEIQISQEEKFDLVADIEHMQNSVKKLLQTKHYQALGEAGIFAVLQKAKSLNVNAIDALNGALYFTQGRVGMTAELMNTLIRCHGHSITKDQKSNDQICILHGRRIDNGDTWTESFSIEDAKKAGIYKNVWEKYPRNMCFNRALSNLARQLFPDVIKGCYEIDELKSFAENPAPINYTRTLEIEQQEVEMSSEDIGAFYKNFNGDEGITRQYIHYCMGKKKCSESAVIKAIQSDLENGQKTYEKWKVKNKPIEATVTPVESPSMEPVSLFETEVK